MSEYLLAEYRAERALWAAVILQAFRDLKLRMDPEGVDPRIRYDAAFQWINDPFTCAMDLNGKTGKYELMEFKTTDVGGFQWVCDHLDLAADWLRIKSMTRQGIEQVLNGHDRGTGRHSVKQIAENDDEE
jgi:hypothetical protein